MTNPFVSALAVFEAGPGAGTVDYRPKASAAVIGVRAIRYDDEVPDGFDGRSLRRVSFEIQTSALAEAPAKEDQIVEAGVTIWFVQQVEYRPEIRAWRLSVERAAT